MLQPGDVDAAAIGLLACFVARCLGDVQDAWLLGGNLPRIKPSAWMRSQLRGRGLI